MKSDANKIAITLVLAILKGMVEEDKLIEMLAGDADA